jgi:predicted ATPase
VRAGTAACPLAPITLRIGLHTGEIQLRDEANYIGPTINRAARVRDLAHGGQTVLTAATEELVVDRLPDGTWLRDVGSHELRDIPRPERVVQLCHQDLRVDFPALRTSFNSSAPHLPVPLTSFVGRTAELAELRRTVGQNRLVTLTGAGGVGKTRLAVQLSAHLADDFASTVHYVDLAPITDPEIVGIAVARAMGLPDQPGSSTIDTLTRRIGNRAVLIVLDNCEHLLEATADVVVALLSSCPAVTLLATSREPIRTEAEATWQVPSLSLSDEAVELFTDRASHVRPGFSVTEDNVGTVTEICRRLDGIPLAIELAAAGMRALSPAEVLDSLHDRFRLLTGGARTAVRRQQTLRASVDWSHSLLTQAEAVLFRRLAVFAGGFDLEVAVAVCGGGDVQRFQVLDQLTLLVDKSLVVAENAGERTRYRMLETIRQYALEKLGESGEADAVRTRHRDYYSGFAAQLDSLQRVDFRHRVQQFEAELDNLRTAFAWSRDNGEGSRALELASSLQPLWQGRGLLREGLSWFQAILEHDDLDLESVPPAVRARALADRAVLDSYLSAADGMEQAQVAVEIARALDDPALLARALTACGYLRGFDIATAAPHFAEAIGLARETGD